MLEIQRFGVLPYEEAWALQKSLAAARSKNEIPDTLLLLQHPHTYTLGSSGKRENLLWSEQECQKKGISILKVDRGGDITYHGPGQLVGYPILQLGRDSLRADVIQYIRMLEEVLIIALADFGVKGERLTGLTGVWVNVSEELAKIAAIGVKVTARAITQHGFALNINTDMTYFQGIIPCGIDDRPVTSLQQLCGAPQDFEAVTDEVSRVFRQFMS
ncbi:MAG: lipoyl(octanoyl) transferase LipB [Anaerolineae bacterium]|nr:lipoyl(octanoyl) transferase LipB [Anaerolineae bacterium]